MNRSILVPVVLILAGAAICLLFSTGVISL